MAVTKIWDIKGRLDRPLKYIQNPEKTKNPKGDNLQSLSDVIEYAANEDKTEQLFFVSAINCNITCARNQFMMVKKTYDKEDGILAYHAYQSFAPGETTPEEAHKIGVELANELWGDRFQVVVATHLNTKYLHNHFVINSVSFRDGKKYNDCKETYRKLRATSDRICKEHGLSVVVPENKKSEPTNLYRKEMAGMPTRYNVARAAIDEAISKSSNMREFEWHIKKMGYKTQFNVRRKYWTVTPQGWNKPIRLARLGEQYTNEKIYERVTNNSKNGKLQDFSKGSRYNLPGRKDKIKKVKGIKGLYLRYCFELGYLPRYNQKPQHIHPLLKEDLLKCERYSSQVRLIYKYKIADEKEIDKLVDSLESKLSLFYETRAELKKVIRRNIPEEERGKAKGQIASITGEMKQIRWEVKMLKEVKLNVPKFTKNLEEIELEQEQRKRKER